MKRLANILRGALAALVLAALAFGVPLLLLTTVANPWPGRDALELRDEQAIITGLLGALISMVWARFMIVVGIELTRQIRWVRDVRVANRDAAGQRRPVRVEPLPAATGGLAIAAQRLIATVLLLIPLTTRAPRPAEAAPPLTVTAPANPTDTNEDIAPQESQPPATERSTGHIEVTVAPNDTLRSLASNYLDDASRWREIYDLNTNRIQVDGRRLTTPSTLRIGWQLSLPADANVPVEPAPASVDDNTDAGSEDSSPVRAMVVELPGAARVPAQTITVEADDTLWDRSEQHLAGHGLDADAPAVLDYLADVVAANAATIENPDLIFPGEQLLLPPVDTTGPGTADIASVAPAPVVYRVVEGDTLWDILDAHVGYVDADLVWEAAARNGLTDPSVIYPGMELVLPGRQPVAPQPGRPEHRDNRTPERPETRDQLPDDRQTKRQDQRPEDRGDREAPRSPSREDRQERDGPAVEHRRDRPIERGRPERSGDDQRPSLPDVGPSEVDGLPDTGRGAPDPPVEPPVAAAAGDQDGAVDDESSLFDQTTRSVWWKVPMGLLLAGGLVMMMRRLRGRRLGVLRRGERLSPPPPVAAGTELAATAMAPASRLSTLQSLLRSVTPHAREHDDPPAVRAVQLDDTRIEILFTNPAPFPPSGWSTVDGGRSWVHRLADQGDAPVRQLLTPALVTIGHRRGGGELLLDVETAGSVALVGDRSSALGLARSMALELATYPLGVPIDVCMVGFEVDGLENCDRAWTATTLVRAVRVAREALDRTVATGAASLTAARAGYDDDEGLLDPQIFIVDGASVGDDDGTLLAELLELCQPQTGAAMILIGDHAKALERIELVSADIARWCGAEVQPPVVDREAAAQVAVMLDHAANSPPEPVVPSAVVADLLNVQSSVDGQAFADDKEVVGSGGVDVGVGSSDADGEPDVEEYRYKPPGYDVLVRVLGEVTVEGREVRSALDVEMLTLLVCMRDKRPNIDTMTAMLGRDTGHRAMQKRVSKLRVTLGVGLDGEDLLPPAALGRGSPGRYQVTRRVLTDVELIEHRYHTAAGLASGDALVVLREGLELFRGPAFRARKGYNWAYPEGVVAKIYATVIGYATRLMELAFDRDDLALVLEAVRCAGSVIDDPVAEMPMRELERDYADACGDPDLAASVHEARRRLLQYVNDTDALAPDTGD